MNASSPAITSQATLAGLPLPPLLRITETPLVSAVGDRDRVFRPPSDDHLPPDLVKGLRRGRVQVLADDLKLSPGVERNQVAGDHPRVADVNDATALGGQAMGALAPADQPDLLGPDREVPAVAVELVGDTDERRDELVGGALVDLGRLADLLD